MTVTDSTGKGCQLFVTKQYTKQPFLVDTGADVSIHLASHLFRHRHDYYHLFAANGSTIQMYARVTSILNLGLRRKFEWLFIVADVVHPIMGAHFLGCSQISAIAAYWTR